MAFSVETVGKLWASGRNYISTAVGFIGGVGLMNASQSKSFMDAIGQIYDGVALVVTGATSAGQILLVAFPIIGVAMAKLASNSAKTESQAASFKAAALDPNTDISEQAKADMLVAVTETVSLNRPIEVTSKKLADAVPSSLVVAAK